MKMTSRGHNGLRRHHPAWLQFEHRVSRSTMPLGSLHPGNPVIGAMGEDRDFDAELFESFQRLLDTYGHAEAVDEKKHVATALTAGNDPLGVALPSGRLARAAFRLALRQEKRRAEHFGDMQRVRRVSLWIARFEPSGGTDDTEDEAPGH